MKLLHKTQAHILITLTLVSTMGMSGPQSENNREQSSKIKFALFSAAWGENTSDNLRIVALNQSLSAIELESIDFIDLPEETRKITIFFDLEIPSGNYAETEVALPDLLSGDTCVNRSIEQNWKLVEISNYTLNPSVRNLIIEDTDSFRIYQCIRDVNLSVRDPETKETKSYQEWVLYHFESRIDN